MVQKVYTRPEYLDADVVRFQNNKEKWIAFVGLDEETKTPHEIFTGILDEDNGIGIPNSITCGRLRRVVGENEKKRYDFEFTNRAGLKSTLCGVDTIFNSVYWNYGKFLSAVLRSRLPIAEVVSLLGGLNFENEEERFWVTGVQKVLKRYL